MSRLHVYIEGNIGAGESTMIQYIRQGNPSWTFHNEPVEQWRNWNGVNYLRLFYEDPKTVCFDFQKVVMASFLVMKNRDRAGVHVYEKNPRPATKVFAFNPFMAGHMTHDKYQHLLADTTVPSLLFWKL